MQCTVICMQMFPSRVKLAVFVEKKKKKMGVELLFVLACKRKTKKKKLYFLYILLST